MESWPTLYNLEAGLGEINVFCPRLVDDVLKKMRKPGRGLDPQRLKIRIFNATAE